MRPASPGGADIIVPSSGVRIGGYTAETTDWNTMKILYCIQCLNIVFINNDLITDKLYNNQCEVMVRNCIS